MECGTHASESSEPRPPIEPLSVVLAGKEGRGHRHVVQKVGGGIVAFLCGRWRPEERVVRVEDRRRHPDMCFPCYKAWERLRKERTT